MVEADVVDLVRRVRTRVEGRGDYLREITQGISEEIGEIQGDKIESIRSRVEPSLRRRSDTMIRPRAIH
jgi:hypothetical protein